MKKLALARNTSGRPTFSRQSTLGGAFIPALARHTSGRPVINHKLILSFAQARV